MVSETKKEEAAPTPAEVLERVRRRLARQASTPPGRPEPNLAPSGAPPAGTPSTDAAVLHQRLAALQTAHAQFGVVNPRRPGLHNDFIQLLKRGMRRLLGWYTRPLVQYQAATNQFLGEATQILDRQQTHVRGLEERIGILAAEVAGLREQLQSRLEWIVSEMEKRDRK